MADDVGINQLMLLANKNWHKPLGAVIACAIAIVIESAILNMAKSNVLTQSILYSLTIILICIYWFYSHRLPKTQKDKIGFAVCIQCSDEIEQRKIREDFVRTLRSLLKQGSIGSSFQFIELPQYIAETINDVDDAYILRQKIRAHFLIFGRVRLRVIDGKDSHILDMEGIVSHAPIPSDVGKCISQEFNELFPRHITIQSENDLMAFNFTSEWTDNVAKYIIGIASEVSQDLDYAESLFNEVEGKLKGVVTDFPIFEKLKQRIPIRYFEIYLTRAIRCLNIWIKTHNPKMLQLFTQNLSKIPQDIPETNSLFILRGIEAFVNRRDIDKAIEYTKKCKTSEDPTWYFNLAFLYAYLEDLHKTIQQYRIGSKLEVNPETISQVEDFILWILEEEPDKIQYHYCLAFFNWKIKGDGQQAVSDFEKFLSCKTDKFSKERELAMQWIHEIKGSS